MDTLRIVLNLPIVIVKVENVNKLLNLQNHKGGRDNSLLTLNRSTTINEHSYDMDTIKLPPHLINNPKSIDSILKPEYNNNLKWAEVLYNKLYGIPANGYDKLVIDILAKLFTERAGLLGYHYCNTPDADSVFIELCAIRSNTVVHEEYDNALERMKISSDKLTELKNDEQEFLKNKTIRKYRMGGYVVDENVNVEFLYNSLIAYRNRQELDLLDTLNIDNGINDTNQEIKPISLFNDDNEKKVFISGYNDVFGPPFPEHLIQNDQCIIS